MYTGPNPDAEQALCPMYCEPIITQQPPRSKPRRCSVGISAILLQSGASSQAKHGGAYFSAVFWSIKDPLAAPGPYETLEPTKLVGIAPPPTLFTTSTKHTGFQNVESFLE